jgi:hypothetical protein
LNKNRPWPARANHRHFRAGQSAALIIAALYSSFYCLFEALFAVICRSETHLAAINRNANLAERNGPNPKNGH